MKLRFLADADLNQAIVNGVLRREPSIDFLTAKAAGLRGLSDLEVLEIAAAQHRAIVSHDINTMPAHFHAFTHGDKRRPGLFLVPQRLDIGRAIEDLLLIWLTTEAVEWENRIQWIPL